ncbi:hypothetical protein PSP6_80088 [Paraburkholderia tropica]|nr:hypothetical protein PSP6_80088 [Paraburkholderia tropica]
MKGWAAPSTAYVSRVDTIDIMQAAAIATHCRFIFREFSFMWPPPAQYGAPAGQAVVKCIQHEPTFASQMLPRSYANS